MHTMNNKKQPPEMFYKKAVLKNFLIENFFIAKFLKTPILKKICERLLLNNVEPNFSSVYLMTA